jgi:diguanylate cyclase (GGDEF)-like protein
VTWLLGAGFLGAAAVLVTVVGARAEWIDGCVLLAAFVVASLVEFEVAAGVALATELVLVPMFLLLPPSTVPLWVAAGTLLVRLPDFVAGRLHPERVLVLLASSWYVIGPALVLTLWGPSTPTWNAWPVYLAALAAQLAFDFASTAARECLVLDTSLEEVSRGAGSAYIADALLAPVGLLAAFALASPPWGIFLLLPGIALLGLLARERRVRIDRALELVSAFRDAHLAARRDVLTGLASRLAWEEALTEMASRRAEETMPVGIILLDLDGLKEANDVRGHDFGDLLLRTAAEVVRSCTREGDLAARIGGDELAVLLPRTSEEACTEVAARLEDAIAGYPLLDGFTLSAAVGFAATPPAGSIEEAVRGADRRLYARKQRGRRLVGLP